MSLNGQHVVKIGESIRKNQKSNLITFRYDFLPGSVATNKPGEVKVDSDKSVSVKLPNQPGSNPDHTLYKGTYKEAMKECVLIVDRNTGQMTLEKIDYNVNLKNCRVVSTASSNTNNKVKVNEETKLSDNSDDVVMEVHATDRHENNKIESGKTNHGYTDPLFGDFSKLDNRNLSDSDEELPHENNHNEVNSDVINDLNITESDLDSDIEDEKQKDVTAQVAEDLQMTDSSMSNSESSSSDSEINS